jgi:hypothetical protein
MRRPKMRQILMPSIALALVLPVLDSGPAAAELVAGGWLMPPRIPQAAPPRPREVVPVVRRREPPPPRPRPANPAPARPALPPSDGKVRF